MSHNPLEPAPERANQPSIMLTAFACIIVVILVIVFIHPIVAGIKVFFGNSPAVASTASGKTSSTPAPTGRVGLTPTTSTSLDPQQLLARVTAKVPSIVDPLTGPSANQWEIANGACYFSNGTYNVAQNVSGYRTQCRLLSQSFDDFALQVDMNMLNGDFGGIAFYVSPQDNLNVGYRFTLTVNGQWSLVAASGTNPQAIASGSAVTFRPGYNTNNNIAIIVVNKNIYAYVNDAIVVVYATNTNASGLIGFYVYESANPTVVAFSNARIWSNP